MTSISPPAQASDESSSEDTFHIPSESQASEPDMPPQRHAGKVGYGPNYDTSAVSPCINISPINFKPIYILIGIHLDAQRQGDRTQGGANGEGRA